MKSRSCVFQKHYSELFLSVKMDACVYVNGSILDDLVGNAPDILLIMDVVSESVLDILVVNGGTF